MTMHDFLQSQSFHDGPRPPAAWPRASDALRGVMRSFDDDTVPFTAYRPAPAIPFRRMRRLRVARKSPLNP